VGAVTDYLATLDPADRAAFARVRDLSRSQRLSMRTAALVLGVNKVALEKKRRGLFP
jgi:glutamate dehydrogenase (NAD(P)+)